MFDFFCSTFSIFLFVFSLDSGELQRWSHVWNITYWNDTIGYCKWIDPFTLFAHTIIQRSFACLLARSRALLPYVRGIYSPKILPHEQFDFSSFYFHSYFMSLLVFSIIFSLSLSFVLVVCAIFCYLYFVVWPFKAILTSIHFDFIQNLLDSLEPCSQHLQVHSDRARCMWLRRKANERKGLLFIIR